MKSEHNIQKSIVKQLRKLNYLVVQTDSMFALAFIGTARRIGFISYAKGQGYTKGVSDLIVFKKGKTVFIEVKKWKIGKKGQAIGKTKQSEEQVAFQEMVEDMGFKYYLIDDDDKINQLIEDLS